MAAFDQAKWIEQANKVVAEAHNPNELYQFALSMLTACHGAGSPQVAAFQETANNIWKDKRAGPDHQIVRYAQGAVRSTVRELENGLVSNVRTAVAGELLGDLVALSREALSEGGDDAKNVAAVLAAAAFEDTLRKLAAEKAAVQGRPPLESVIVALKDKELLKGGHVSQANSLLTFRNSALHAHWEKVAASQVESCLALVDALLSTHFS